MLHSVVSRKKFWKIYLDFDQDDEEEMQKLTFEISIKSRQSSG